MVRTHGISNLPVAWDHVVHNRGTLARLVKDFPSDASDVSIPCSDLDLLEQIARTPRKKILYEILPQLLEVHANPLSSLANLPATHAHQIIANYIMHASVDRVEALPSNNKNDSVIIGHWYFLGIDDLVKVARGKTKVELDPKTDDLLTERRQQFENYLTRTGRAVYGTNTGFGPNQDKPVSDKDLHRLQVDLIRSHSTGMGESAPEDIVRATMLLRARSLANGNSGVRPQVVKQLIDFLNCGITPVVPVYGSVGASGDLAPLSHIALALIGEGDVSYNGKRISASRAIQKAGLSPLKLAMKEGLALNNGVQYSTAMAALACSDLENLLNTACLSTSITAQVMLGKDDPYKSALHDLRPHPGAKKAARIIQNFTNDSPIITTMKAGHDGNVQDPYNLRCSPQIIGDLFDSLDEAKEFIQQEMNSATDNPLFLRNEATGEYTEVISGGHFHGAPIAKQLYHLIEASCNMNNLIYTRCARYVDEARNRGMPGDLAWLNLSVRKRATSSAMMIPEYVEAALANATLGNSAPSHLFNFPTAQGQEDHVSMAPNLGIRLHREVIPLLNNGLAIELAYGAQAAAIRYASTAYPSRISPKKEVIKALKPEITALKAAAARQYAGTPFEPVLNLKLQCPWTEDERKVSPSCQPVIDKIHTVFPPVKRDRVMSRQLGDLAKLVQSGELLDLAKQKLSISQHNTGLTRTRELDANPHLEREVKDTRNWLVTGSAPVSHRRFTTDRGMGVH